MTKRLIIAIDGPAGAGKSTISKRLAEQLGYLFIDTGAMYRAVAWKALHNGFALSDHSSITALAECSQVELKGPPGAQRVFIDDREVTTEIRTPQVSQAASIVSAISGVRRALVAQQQRMGSQGGVVLEGRDIGTAVFPNADVKFYLDASVEMRAQRRFVEDTAKGIQTTFDATRADIAERDKRDMNRSDSPLIKAADAVYLDTSELGLDQVTAKMLEIIESRK
ncbi:MAG TPA: (d)CMP kinase [Blastocatellia bacterium]|nr:(d)CMP kinase [Blastocatellia bacterium]